MSARPAPEHSARPVPWALLAAGGLIVAAGLLVPALLPTPTSTTLPQASTEIPALPQTPQPDVRGMLVRLFGGTVLVLGLCLVTLLVSRRWLTRSASPNAMGQLEVLGAVRVDARSRVYLVRARGQRLLAAVDIEGLKLLVPVPPSVEAPVSEQPTSTAPLPAESRGKAA